MAAGAPDHLALTDLAGATLGEHGCSGCRSDHQADQADAAGPPPQRRSRPRVGRPPGTRTRPEGPAPGRRDPGAPRWLKPAVLAIGAYVVSPIDLVPDADSA